VKLFLHIRIQINALTEYIYILGFVVVLTEVLCRLAVDYAQLLGLLPELGHAVVRYVHVLFHWRRDGEKSSPLACRPSHHITVAQEV